MNSGGFGGFSREPAAFGGDIGDYDDDDDDRFGSGRKRKSGYNDYGFGGYADEEDYGYGHNSWDQGYYTNTQASYFENPMTVETLGSVSPMIYGQERDQLAELRPTGIAQAPSLPLASTSTQQQHHQQSPPTETEIVMAPQKIKLSDMTNPPTKMYIAFVKGEQVQSSKTWKRLMNWAITASGGYTHCEIIIETQNGQRFACCIHYGESVTFEQKYYEEAKWHLFMIKARPEEIVEVLNFCLEQKNKPFNKLGLYMNFIPVLKWFAYNAKGKSWFCSELCLTAVQIAKRGYEQYMPWKTPPSELFELLEKHGDWVMSNPRANKRDLNALGDIEI